MLKPVDSILRTSGLLNQEAASLPPRFQQRNFERRPGAPAKSGPAFRVSFSSQALSRVVNFRNIPETLSPAEKDKLLAALAQELKKRNGASGKSDPAERGATPSTSRSWVHQESRRGTVDYAVLLEQLRNRQQQETTTEDVEETDETEEEVSEVDDGDGSEETPVDEVDSGSGEGEEEVVVTDEPPPTEENSESPADPELVLPDPSEPV